MQNSLLLGLSQQMTLRRNMDIIAHNLANMGTTAYKVEQPVFQSYLQDFVNADGQSDKLSFTDDYGMIRNTDEGEMKRTTNPLDVGIVGKGFFAVETPAGERYTRNGHFSINNEGTLVSADGFPVLDANRQPIVFAPEEEGLSISRDGSMSTNLGEKGRFLLVEFQDESTMKREGGSLFGSEAVPEPALGAELQQGFLEGSNVVPIKEMTNMISVMQAYTRTSKLIKDAEELTQRTVRELGRTTV